MPSKSSLDGFDNFFSIGCAGSAATSGALSAQLVTGITNLQKVAWAISRIEYFFPRAWFLPMSSTQNFIMLSLTQSATAQSAVPPAYAALIDYMFLVTAATPAADNTRNIMQQPYVHTFAAGHEVLALPQSLFLHVDWTTASNLSTDTAGIRCWYREVELGPEDWYDLLQLRLPLGAY